MEVPWEHLKTVAFVEGLVCDFSGVWWEVAKTA